VPSSPGQDSVAIPQVHVPEVPSWPRSKAGQTIVIPEATLPRPPEPETVAIPQCRIQPNPAGGKQQGRATAKKKMFPPWPDPAGGKQQGKASLADAEKIATDTLPRPPESPVIDWAVCFDGATTKAQLDQLLIAASNEGRLMHSAEVDVLLFASMRYKLPD
jgi:hypothetical protein